MEHLKYWNIQSTGTFKVLEHLKGEFQSNPKLLEHFLCTNNFGILGRKGGGWTKSKSFWALFPNIWCPKIPALEEVPTN